MTPSKGEAMNRPLGVPAVFLLCLAASSNARAAAPMDSNAALARARELRPYVSSGTPGPLWSVFDTTMRSAMGDSTRFAGTLTGIAKRELKGVDLLAIKTPDDLPAAVDLLNAGSDA